MLTINGATVPEDNTQDRPIIIGEIDLSQIGTGTETSSAAIDEIQFQFETLNLSMTLPSIQPERKLGKLEVSLVPSPHGNRILIKQNLQETPSSHSSITVSLKDGKRVLTYDQCLVMGGLLAEMCDEQSQEIIAGSDPEFPQISQEIFDLYQLLCDDPDFNFKNIQWKTITPLLTSTSF